MATSQSFLFADNSTVANYTNWASVIGHNLATFGWVQSSDTGQVQWASATLTAVAVSGTNATYTYSGLTGRQLASGYALAITGMTNSANNGTKVVTAVTGTTSGTFTVVNASAVVESGSTGALTAQSSAPGSGAFFYEIWEPNDGLTNFFLKLETGNFTGLTNGPCVRVSTSQTTNGAGTLTGTVAGTKQTVNLSTSFGGGAGAVPYECNFSGGLGRFSMMLWRNAPNSLPQVFCIERSINSSGTYTGTYVTFMTVGASGSLPTCTGTQTSHYFGGNVSATVAAATVGGIAGLTFPGPGTTFNQSIPFATVQPMVGFFDWPCTVLGFAYTGALAEAVPFSITLYGSTITYLPSNAGTFSNSLAANGAFPAQYATLCMRYD